MSSTGGIMCVVAILYHVILGVEGESIFLTESLEAAVTRQNGVSTERIWLSPCGQGPSCRTLDASLSKLGFHLIALNIVNLPRFWFRI